MLRHPSSESSHPVPNRSHANFSYRIHEDIDKIVRDIKKDHTKDPMTADDPSPAETIRKQMEEAVEFEGGDHFRASA